MNPANYQNPLIRFDFPSHFGTQPAIAGIYFARIQRAPDVPIIQPPRAATT